MVTNPIEYLRGWLDRLNEVEFRDLIRTLLTPEEQNRLSAPVRSIDRGTFLGDMATWGQLDNVREYLKKKFLSREPVSLLPGPPPDEILRRTGFINRFIELQEIKTRLSHPRYPPVTVVSGPMGYGKTYLLREVAKDLLGNGWDCALLECEEHAKQDIAAVRNALAYACGCGKVADWSDISACLGRRISAQPQKHKVALLVDGIDWLSKGVRHQVLAGGLPGIYDGVKNAKGKCSIVLSGRYIESDLGRVNEEIKARGDLPFGQAGAWYSEIRLSEFGQDDIIELIHRVSQLDFEPEEYQGMVDSLLEITGGHPGGLVRIVTEDLHEKRGWTFEKNPRKKGFYFDRETKKRLFTTYMSYIIPETKGKIGKQWQEDFQAVGVLRKFDADMLQHLIDAGVICYPKGDELIKELSARGLIHEQEKEPGLWGDAIARGVARAAMKMFSAERYVEVNWWAAEALSSALDRICTDYRICSSVGKLALKPRLTTYAVELIYYRLEAEIPFGNAWTEVFDKLTPLGPDIVQQFIKEFEKQRIDTEKKQPFGTLKTGEGEKGLRHAEERTSLQRELLQRKRNLYHLREKAAKHGIDVPISVLNQIEDEEREIKRIEMELERL